MSYGGDETSRMKVESRSVGRIIGRGGSKIKELEERSNAKIKILQEEDYDGKKEVEISGSNSEIQRAKDLIEECLEAGNDFGGRGGGGRGGYSSGFGRREGGGGFGGRRDDGYGRRDNYGGGGGGGFGRRDGGGRDSGDSYGRRDNYGGNRGGDRGGFGEDNETIMVESGEVGRIIGKGGSRIREMEDKSGCRIKVSRDADSHGRSSVELSGSKGEISKAKGLIQDAGVDIMNGDDRGRGW